MPRISSWWQADNEKKNSVVIKILMIPVIGMKNIVIRRVEEILRIYIGCMNENLLCLYEMDTYKKSIITRNTKKMTM